MAKEKPKRAGGAQHRETAGLVQIAFDCEAHQREEYHKAAALAGARSTTRWITQILDAAAKAEIDGFRGTKPTAPPEAQSE